jgi:hypothetical protein
MRDFRSRAAAQRALLRTVNASGRWREPLYGLTDEAVERWIMRNELSGEARLPSLLRHASSALCALANQSQAAVVDEAAQSVEQIARLRDAIAREVAELAR